MPDICTSIVEGGVMTEAQRFAEIAELAKDQLSQATDLPKSPRVLINGSQLSIKEIPMPPQIIAFHRGGGFHLPKAEHTYVRGRTWTI